MTEYDYSPAAYERYVTNQTRVSSWISSQSSHTRSYSNPFTPPPSDPRPPKSSSRPRSSTITSHTTTPTHKTPTRSYTTQEISSRSSAEQSRHHPPSRSRTMPPGQILQPQPRHPTKPLSQAVLLSGLPQQQDPHYHRSRSSYHDRSRTKSPPTFSHHHHQSSTSRSQSYTTDRDASGRRIIQLDRASTNKVVHIPAPREGEQYVILPPPGGTVEVLNPEHLHMEYVHEPEQWGREREERLERVEAGRDKTTTPFFKRLFSGLTRGGSRQYRGDQSRGPSPKSRSRYSSSGHRRIKSL